MINLNEMNIWVMLLFNTFCDFFTDPVKLLLLRELRSEFFKLQDDILNEYDRYFPVDGSIELIKFKHDFNIKISTYNSKVSFYNERKMWYQQSYPFYDKWG